jgi:hypothetical protein
MGDAPSRRDSNFSDLGEQAAPQQRKHARLPDAVSTNHTNTLTGVNGQVQMLEQGFTASLECNVVNNDHGFVASAVSAR